VDCKSDEEIDHGRKRHPTILAIESEREEAEPKEEVEPARHPKCDGRHGYHRKAEFPPVENYKDHKGYYDQDETNAGRNAKISDEEWVEVILVAKRAAREESSANIAVKLRLVMFPRRGRTTNLSKMRLNAE
jgi:hypothetical protein